MGGEVENMADLRKKDPIQQVGSNERALRVGESCRLRAALSLLVLVDFPSREIGKIKKDSGLCGVRPACAAGSRRVADPDPLVACGRDSYFPKQKKKRHHSVSLFSGGSYRARTCDPLLVRQMLSQLS